MLSKFFMKKSKAEGLMSVALSILVIFMLAGGVALMFSSTSANSKLLEAQTHIIVLRSQLHQTFSSSSGYGELSNDLAIQVGAVPQVFIKGTSLINQWGGAITLEPSDDESAFWVIFANVPSEECNKLASYQSDTWLEIMINGTTIVDNSISTVANACSSSSNSLSFSAR